MRAYFILCVSFVAWAEQVQAQAQTQAQSQTKSIDEIRFEKVGIETSLADFLKLHPNAKQEMADDDKFGVKQYGIEDVEEGTLSGFEYFDGKIIRMLVHWSSKGVDNAGGTDKIVSRIVKKYGKADSEGIVNNQKCLRWVSKSSTNTLLISHSNSGLTVTMFVSKQQEQLNEYKAKLAKKKIDD